MAPEDLASQSVRLKEEQLRREEEKLREIEVKVQREINERRQELLARESQLKEMLVPCRQQLENKTMLRIYIVRQDWLVNKINLIMMVFQNLIFRTVIRIRKLHSTKSTLITCAACTNISFIRLIRQSFDPLRSVSYLSVRWYVS